MTQLSWDQTGERYFETGVDRGVLYPVNSSGVVWNGLTSVEESPTGGDSVPYYLDGVKYLNSSSSEEFGATITAFTFPEEFYECDGTDIDSPGLNFEQQTRKPFGLCYRTKVGNDVNSLDYGYKLHIIYNALASPSSRQNSSLTDSVDAIGFSWSVTSLPVFVSGHKPMSSVVIDSTKMSSANLATIEDILYGGPESDSRLPTIDELSLMFKEWWQLSTTFDVINNGDGTFTVNGPDSAFEFPSNDEFAISMDTAVYVDENTYIISSI